MSADRPSTRDLLRSSASGDHEAINELLVRYLPALHAFVRLRAGEAFRGRESSSDLVQSVCREVLAEAGDYTYRGEAAFKNWLFTAATNKVIDRHRFHHREKRDAAREVAADDRSGELYAAYASIGTPSQQIAQQEAITRIEAAFEQLPPQQREVIALSRIGKLTYAEIAAETGRTETAVRGLVVRGLSKLSQLLDRDAD